MVSLGLLFGELIHSTVGNDFMSAFTSRRSAFRIETTGELRGLLFQESVLLSMSYEPDGINFYFVTFCPSKFRSYAANRLFLRLTIWQSWTNVKVLQIHTWLWLTIRWWSSVDLRNLKQTKCVNQKNVPNKAHVSSSNIIYIYIYINIFNRSIISYFF